MIISKTPYRLSLFGGGTDFPQWYNSNPSTIIVASMDYSCYVTISRKPNFFPEYKSRVAYGKIEHVNDNGDIVHPSVRECLRFFNFESGIDIYHAGDLIQKWNRLKLIFYCRPRKSNTWLKKRQSNQTPTC